MHNGWIKSYRKTLQSPIFGDAQKFKLWSLLLFKATHTNRKQIVGNHFIPLEQGQFVTGRVSLASDYNRGEKPKGRVSEQTLWRWLKMFEQDEMLNIESTSKYSVITITNWNLYQQGELQVFINETISDEQVNTDNNVENVNNLKNVNKNNSRKSTTSDVDIENAKLLYELILENDYLDEPNFDKYKWADHFRILRNKGYEDVSDDTIKYLIEFSQEDSYWQKIIRSAEDFKVHYPRIYMCT